MTDQWRKLKIKLEDLLKDDDYLVSRHGDINKSVGDRLWATGLYDEIIHNAIFYDPVAKKHGEFDHIARRGYVINIFEIKSSVGAYYKAKKQLRKERNYIHHVFGREYKVNMFFVYGNKKTNGYNIRRVK